MCDALVALGNVTTDGVTILGKNSDREPNEAHHPLRISAARHAPGGHVTGDVFGALLRPGRPGRGCWVGANQDTRCRFTSGMAVFDGLAYL